jgi:hypothetical protein
LGLRCIFNLYYGSHVVTRIQRAREFVDEGATFETMSLPKFQEKLTAQQRTFWEHREFRNNTASREEAEQILVSQNNKSLI